MYPQQSSQTKHSQRIRDPNFFEEWPTGLPELTEMETLQREFDEVKKQQKEVQLGLWGQGQGKAFWARKYKRLDQLRD